MNNRKNVFLGLLLSLLLLGGFIFYIQSGVMVPDGASDSFYNYEKYSKRKLNGESNTHVYFNPVVNSEYDWYVSVYNESGYFWCGDVSVYDEEGTLIFYEECVNIAPDELRNYGLTGETSPSTYTVEKEKVYEFTLTKPDFAVYESVDLDTEEEYIWRNLVFEDDKDLTEENCLLIGEYYYITDILSGNDSMDIYCYSRTKVEYYEEKEEYLPEKDSAVFGIILSQEEKKIKVVDILDNFELLTEKVME